jgi:hypothetical protein
MSMQPRASRTDARARHGSQAYSTTYFGKAMETGPSGLGQRLEGVCRNRIPVTGNASLTGVQLAGDLTEGLMILGVINHKPLAAGTLNLTLPEFGGQPAVPLIVGADLTVAAQLTLATDNFMPLATDRPLEIEIIGGDDEEFLISLDVTPMLSGWK